MTERQRLQKYIANCGYCSRRKAELLIQNGLVTVNGKPVIELGWKVTPGSDEVTINGQRIVPPTRCTIAFNKPAGVITSTHDTHDRLTVVDLLPREIADRGVLPAGRLDLETEGLLIFTNDGELQHRITHPRYACEKEYVATLNQRPTDQEIDKLRRGVYLEEVGKTTQPAEVEILTSDASGKTVVRVLIKEGMKRQVRRMFETVRRRVVHLERTRIGGVRLGDLPRRGWRDLTPDEITGLTQFE